MHFSVSTDGDLPRHFQGTYLLRPAGGLEIHSADGQLLIVSPHRWLEIKENSGRGHQRLRSPTDSGRDGTSVSEGTQCAAPGPPQTASSRRWVRRLLGSESPSVPTA